MADPKSEGKEDKHKIKDIINDYLFNLCFNPAKNENVEHFIDYLFRNFASVFASAREDGRAYIPHINEFTKVLDKAKLATYWQTHGEKIKALNLDQKNKTVFVSNYVASYKEYLPMIYRVLDDHAKEIQASALATVEVDNKN